MKILVVDGSTFIRIMLTGVLERLGFNVVGTAKDAQEALDKFKKLEPDVVMIDAEIKGMDFIELIRVMITERPACVIIAMIPPSHNIPELIVDAIRAGARGYLRKPISEREVEDRLRGALRRR